MSLIRGGHGGYGGARRYEPSHGNSLDGVRLYEPSHANIWDGAPRRYEPSSHANIWDSPHDDAHLRSALTSSHIEWKDTRDAHVYKVHLPALRPDEVKVEVEEDERAVVITGEKKMEREERKGMAYQMERTTGRMVQRLSLPENAKMSHVKAYMDHGVLTVTVPKHEVPNYYNQARRPRLINISGN